MESPGYRYSYPFTVNDFEDPSVCARCARMGTTCCCSHAGDIVAPLSERELDNILTQLPWVASQDFYEEVPNHSKFITSVEGLFPHCDKFVRNIFPPEGKHYQLAMDNTGRCSMLGSYGCLLPNSLRPLFCRIFPFWFTGTFQPQVFSHTGCLALRESNTTRELCQMLGETPESLHDLYLQLCLSWGFPPPTQH